MSAADIGVLIKSSTKGIDPYSPEGKQRIAEWLAQKLREAGFACELSLPLEDGEK
jgi:hypothetical protein